METIREEAFEGTATGDHAGIGAEAEVILNEDFFKVDPKPVMRETTGLNQVFDFEKAPNLGLDDFNEDEFSTVVEKLSFMDRERYLELQRTLHRLNGMRADLILADLEHDNQTEPEARNIARDINSRYGNLAKKPIIDRERKRL